MNSMKKEIINAGNGKKKNLLFFLMQERKKKFSQFEK